MRNKAQLWWLASTFFWGWGGVMEAGYTKVLSGGFLGNCGF